MEITYLVTDQDVHVCMALGQRPVVHIDQDNVDDNVFVGSIKHTTLQ